MSVCAELYRRVYLVRRAEEAVRSEYPKDEMKTPVHLSIGQEAIAAAVCLALGPEGACLSSYRSHAAYLSRTLETDRYFAELFGRATGVAKGKAGSMHLAAPAQGFLGSSAVVATPLPLAVGAALANRRLGRPGWVAVFFGDGAVDEGVFHESLNLACLWRLRVLFVCEDNGLAIHSRASDRQGHKGIPALAAAYRCAFAGSDSTVADDLHRLALETMAKGESEGTPAFLHFRCFRYLEHVGIHEDFAAGYRSREEAAVWTARDPVRVQRERLAREWEEARIRELESGIDRQIEASLAAARKAPFPPPGELLRDVLAP